MPRTPSSERDIAVQILLDVTESAAYANITLRQTLSKEHGSTHGLNARGRAFITELTNGVLRNIIRIDHVIDHFSKIPVKAMKPFIRAVLRVAVYQLRFMDRVPPSAAVNEAVRMTKARGLQPLAGFVNGVLRSITRQPDAPALPNISEPLVGETDAIDYIRYIQLAYSYPTWLAAYIIERLGVSRALSFCRHSHTPPSVTVFTNILKITPEQLAARLQSESAICRVDAMADALTNVSTDVLTIVSADALGMQSKALYNTQPNTQPDTQPNTQPDTQPDTQPCVLSGALYAECLRLRHVTDMTKLPSFQEGLFHVMDEGALAAVKALDPKPGMRVLDLCAAPGGKTFACAALMADCGTVEAYDIHPHRLALIRETASRLGFTCITVAKGDASQLNPALSFISAANTDDAANTNFGADVNDAANTNFATGTTDAVNTNFGADAVLLDAPCSGLGILRKRPDIKLTRKPEDIAELVQKQRAMLATAAAYVKPGGTLVYCVCTITREEGIEQIRWFTEQFPFTVEPFAMESITAEPTMIDALVEDHCTQLLPGPNNDGFFIAKLQRKG